MWIIFILTTFVGFTQLSISIVSYVYLWKFQWSNLILRILIWSLIISIIWGSIAYVESQNFSKLCSNNGETWDIYGQCSCVDGYIKTSGWVCSMTLENIIKQKIPTGAILREYKELAWNNGLYVWIYIKNYKFDKEMNTVDTEIPYSTCPEEVQWQWISWEYHLFTFQNNLLTSDIIIPLGFRNISYPGAELNLSYMNTKLNNSYYFWWVKPKDNSEEYIIEKSDLLNFKDYTGDGIPYEFLLLDHWDQVCWHNNYLVAWINSQLKIVIYWIKWNNGTVFWDDNFIPDSKWEIQNGWQCWDHWAWTEKKNIYFFSPQTNTFILKSSTEKDCSDKLNIILQDINLRNEAWSNGKIIKPLLKWLQVTINETKKINWITWYQVSTPTNEIWWISQIGFIQDKSKASGAE